RPVVECSHKGSGSPDRLDEHRSPAISRSLGTRAWSRHPESVNQTVPSGHRVELPLNIIAIRPPEAAPRCLCTWPRCGVGPVRKEDPEDVRYQVAVVEFVPHENLEGDSA